MKKKKTNAREIRKRRSKWLGHVLLLPPHAPIAFREQHPNEFPSERRKEHRHTKTNIQGIRQDIMRCPPTHTHHHHHHPIPSSLVVFAEQHPEKRP